MGCCEPVRCGSCDPRELAEGPSDSCLCGCLFLNGFLPGLLALTLLFLGMCFSWAAIGDCSFVTTDSRVLLPDGDFDDLPEDFTGFREFGMIFFARPNGECYWYENGLFPEDQLEWYINQLTPSMNVGRGFAGIGALGGFFVFCYSLSLICSAQVKGARLFSAFILIVFLTIFQFLSILVVGSDFCTENGCSISRSCSWSIVAGCSYFCGGFCFLFMSDYPGESILAEEKERAKHLQSEPTAVAVESPLEVESGEAEAVESGEAEAFEAEADESPMVDPEQEIEPEVIEAEAKIIDEEAGSSGKVEETTEGAVVAADEEQGKAASSLDVDSEINEVDPKAIGEEQSAIVEEVEVTDTPMEDKSTSNL